MLYKLHGIQYLFLCVLILCSENLYANDCQRIFNQEIAHKEIKSVSHKGETREALSDYLKDNFSNPKYQLAALKAANQSLSIPSIAVQYPRLEASKELKLLDYYMENQNEQIFYILFLSNVRTIQIIAKTWTHSHQKYDDLMQEGLIALTRAINLFEDNHQASFQTYLNVLVKNSFRNYASRTNQSLTGGSHLLRLAGLLKQEQERNPTNFGSQKQKDDFIKAHPKYTKKHLEYVLLHLFRKDQTTITKLDQMLVSTEPTSYDSAGELPDSRDMFSDEGRSSESQWQQKYINEIYEWTIKQLQTKQKSKVLLNIAKNRIFVNHPLKTADQIAREEGLSTRQAIIYHEQRIRKMIKDRFEK